MKVKCFHIKGRGVAFTQAPDPKMSNKSISEQIQRLKETLRERGVAGVQIDPEFEESNQVDQITEPDKSLEEVTRAFLFGKVKSQESRTFKSETCDKQ